MKIRLILAGILMSLGITACSGNVSGQEESGRRIVSIATVQPENHPVSIGLKAMKDYLEEELGPNIEVKIYYNSIMGGNSEAIELLQMGTLNLVATSGSNLEAFSDIYKIFGLPYVFKDEESFRKCMNNEEFVSQIYNCTADKGIQGVAWFANGINNIYSFRPIRTPDDLKGLKFRIQSSEANVRLAEGWGAAATVLAYGEVYTAMQNHVIDAAANPEMALISAKHGEVAKYYSRTEHQIFTDVLIANVDFLESLSDKEKVIFQQAFKIATDVECEEWDKQTKECIEEAEKIGVEFIDVDKKPFEELQKPVREGLLNDFPELKPLYELVQSIQGE